MIGLFQELGPCRINNQSTGVDLNPMSWNNNANVYALICLNSIRRKLNGGGSVCSLTSLSVLASRTGRCPSVPRGRPLSTYGSSCKSGLQTRDSKSTPIGILQFGRNHMVDTTAPYLLRASPSFDSSPHHSMRSSIDTF
jgi:hypothetical protein